MTFLKWIGKALLAGVKGIDGGSIGSIISAVMKATAGAIDWLAVIMNYVVVTESIGQQAGIPGPERAKLIAPMIAQAFLKTDLLTGRHCDQPELFKAACERLGGDVADILNSFEPPK